jgi:hypothetical protein
MLSKTLARSFPRVAEIRSKSGQWTENLSESKPGYDGISMADVHDANLALAFVESPSSCQPSLSTIAASRKWIWEQSVLSVPPAPTYALKGRPILTWGNTKVSMKKIYKSWN